MATFILTWNPDKTGWEDAEYAKAIALTARSQTVPHSWSLGGRRGGIERDDRAFLLRQKRDRGIVASGRFTGELFEDEHWDGSGEIALYADVVWDTACSPDDRLPVEDLHGALPEVHWDRFQASGSQLDDASAEALELLWTRHLGDKT